MAADGPVLIAGAGIAGLAIAVALARKGIPARVVERRDRLSAEGAGIQIGPNGMRILAELGAAATLEPLAGKPEAIAIRDGASARPIAELPLGDWLDRRHGAPYRVAHRADLQTALLVPFADLGLAVDLGFDLASVEETPAGVEVVARDGHRVAGRALIGADGAFSTVRRIVVPGAEPVYSGKHAMRTVLPLAGAPGPFARNATGVWLSPDAHVVHYPVRGGRELAIVAITDEAEPNPGWSRDIAAADVLARLAAFSPDLTAFLRRAEHWRAWSLYEAPPLPAWARGRIALAGDAAHPILPFLAQGGVMALEDATTLAASLARASDPATAFTAYERQRKLRVTRVQEASRRNGRIYHLSGLARIARDTTLRAVPGTTLMQGLDWLYGWTGDPARA